MSSTFILTSQKALQIHGTGDMFPGESSHPTWLRRQRLESGLLKQLGLEGQNPREEETSGKWARNAITLFPWGVCHPWIMGTRWGLQKPSKEQQLWGWREQSFEKLLVRNFWCRGQGKNWNPPLQSLKSILKRIVVISLHSTYLPEESITILKGHNSMQCL